MPYIEGTVEDFLEPVFPRPFLKYHTDGDIGHGGCRYACTECDAEYSAPFEWREHTRDYCGGCDGDVVQILFDSDGHMRGRKEKRVHDPVVESPIDSAARKLAAVTGGGR